MRSDRNLYSKNLLEAQGQVVVMKRKFNILTHAIQQLKQEIVTKDQYVRATIVLRGALVIGDVFTISGSRVNLWGRYLVKEHFSHHRVENEIQMLRNDLTRIRKQIQSSEQIINNQV